MHVLVYPSMYLSVHVHVLVCPCTCTCLYVGVLICLSMYLSAYTCPCLSVHVSVCPCTCLSACLFSLSTYLHVCPSNSLYLSVCISVICLSLYLCVFLSTFLHLPFCLFFYLSVSLKQYTINTYVLYKQMSGTHTRALSTLMEDMLSYSVMFQVSIGLFQYCRNHKLRVIT